MGLPRENRLCERAAYMKINMTLAERKLWFHYLREYPLCFVRQKIIGPYIVDFFCNKARLSIELDGTQHLSQSSSDYDRIRTNYLEMLEIRELRFPNTYLWNDFDGVCNSIHQEIESRRTDLITVHLSLLKNKK